MNRYRRYLTTFTASCAALFLSFVSFLQVVNSNFVDTSLKDKVYLLEQHPAVIFAGDSRAQRQLDPLYFTSQIDADRVAVNIAVEAASVMSIAQTIDRYPEVFESAAVVLSVSSAQVNEKAFNGGSFPMPMIARLSIPEQVLRFSPDNLDVLKIYYRRAFKDLRKSLTGRLKSRRDDESTLGFRPIDQVWDVSGVSRARQEAVHHWRAPIVLGGHKTKLFEQALLDVDSKVGKLVVFNGPVAPSYRKLMHGSSLINNEIVFERYMSDLCRKRGIPFEGYAFDDRFLDEDFYDPYHLNVTGAEKLTRIVFEDFLSR